MSDLATPRTYRFDPPERGGWALGLGRTQVLVLGAALVVAVALRAAGAGLGPAALPLAAGLVAALGRWGPLPLVEAAPALLSWAGSVLTGRRRWRAPVPLLGADPDASPALPPALAGQEVLAVDAGRWQSGRSAQVAVVHDRGGRHGRLTAVAGGAVAGLGLAVAFGQLAAGAVLAGAGAGLGAVLGGGGRRETYAATLPVVGATFALAEPAEQDRLVEAWGRALAGVCVQDGPVCALRWAEWAAPGGMAEQLGWLADHGDPDGPAAADYRAFLADVGPLAARHEVLLTLAVAADRVPARGGDRRAAALDCLLGEVAALAGRLEAAGLLAGPPLSPAQLARALRARLDPAALAGLEARSLGQAVGVVGLANAGPLATEVAWDHWRVDGSVHRAFVVTEWPRREVLAGWLAPLLLAAGAVRTVAVVAEPVPPRASRAAIVRQATRIEAGASHRDAVGLRVGAEHARAADAVAAREAELLAGHAELTYVGLVVVSAPDAQALESGCAEVTAAAGAAGLELRALHGRHDAAVAACLPLARALARSPLA